MQFHRKIKLNKQYFFILLIILSLVLVSQAAVLPVIASTSTDYIYDVVVVGAGSAGIAASYTLTQHNVQHLILESRDRIGGRIISASFQGQTIDLGASFVHFPNSTNQIYNIMKQLNWSSKPANYNSQYYIRQQTGVISDQIIEKAYDLYQRLSDSIDTVSTNSQVDISIAAAAQPFLNSSLIGQTNDIIDLVYWNLQIQANTDGAELNEISSWDNTPSDSNQDILPVGGFSSLMNAIFNYCRPIVKLNERVIKIDYNSDPILIYTTNSRYQAKKVISSLPLGVLKNNLVQFSPTLSAGHLNAISKLGNGVFNKLFVSFNTPFWPANRVWVNFITSQPSKYPIAINLSDPNNGKYVLCFFVAGAASIEIGEWSDDQIKSDLAAFLSKFTTSTILSISFTRWQKDINSMGSYSYMKVGATKHDIKQLQKSINSKLWFVGEHCNPDLYACVHSAYQTGQQAAQQVLVLLNK